MISVDVMPLLCLCLRLCLSLCLCLCLYLYLYLSLRLCPFQHFRQPLECRCRQECLLRPRNSIDGSGWRLRLPCLGG